MSATNHLLEVIEPVVAKNFHNHFGMAQEAPHVGAPWNEGRDCGPRR
ncbi:hypothetical protein [Nocardioides dilutus]